jgi:glutamine amidotransferase
MGWNTIDLRRAGPLLAGFDGATRFYFVHSYAGPVNEFTLAATTHGRDFAAVVQRDNFSGVQFHPERSGAAGAHLLRNFLEAGA